MTPEQLLLSAITGVTSALVYVCRLLWNRSEQCEKDRTELRDEIEILKGEHGESTGELKSFRRCPSQVCPFKTSLSTNS